MRLTPETVLEDALKYLQDGSHGRRIGVAVSGGSDSLALLVLAQEWATRCGFHVHAVTVDHGLRVEAAAEIAHVAQVCAALDVPHDVLPWAGWDGSGNLQAQARAARLDLLADWCDAKKLVCVLLGHTADDQAETVLMHLARGSGVDGLAGIHDVRDCFVRPLLNAGRDDLRAVLQARSMSWCEDSSNTDLKFDRVRARQMMEQLTELGLTRARLVQTAKHMQNAQISLVRAAVDFSKAHVRVEAGDLLIPKRVFDEIESDTQARIVAGGLMWIGRQMYRPRYAALLDMAQAVARGHTRTLHGVHLTTEGSDIRMAREFGALDLSEEIKVSDENQLGYPVWDSRWRVFRCAPVQTVVPYNSLREIPVNLTIRALGDSLKDVPEWRKTGIPRASLMATPAVFGGDSLIAAPVAGLQNGFEARIVADFTSFLVSR